MSYQQESYLSQLQFDGIIICLNLIEAKLFQENNVFHRPFYLPEVNIQDQTGHGVLNRLVPHLKCMEL